MRDIKKNKLFEYDYPECELGNLTISEFIDRVKKDNHEVYLSDGDGIQSSIILRGKFLHDSDLLLIMVRF